MQLLVWRKKRKENVRGCDKKSMQKKKSCKFIQLMSEKLLKMGNLPDRDTYRVNQ